MDMVHMTSQEWRGVVYSVYNPIVRFIDRDIPTNWERWPLKKRRKWWRDDEFRKGLIKLGLVKTCKREKITGLELWCEFFNCDREDYQQTHARVINEVLGHIPTLTKLKTDLRFGPYGIQRGFKVQRATDD